ncbi:MAG: DNA-binding protein [Gammaproteobacteria bacterium]|nr:MAG: DNA-binding protein [Gammaproteobacteria bacterium]
MAKTTAIKETQTKSEILATLAEETGLSKKDVSAVLDALGNLAHRHLKPRGSGEITIPGLGLKLRRVKRPATKARKGRNPQTGEEITIKARPAHNVVRATILKSLKEAVK